MIKKQYLKSRPVCKVTFYVPGDAGSQVELAGDFNNWAPQPMKQLKDGRFSATLELEPGREYQFRYRLDGSHWRNEEEADRQVPNEFGEENSVLAL